MALQLCFACRFTMNCCLTKEHLPRSQEMLEQACLEHHCERSLKLCDWPSTQVSLVLVTGEPGIGCGVH